MTFGGQIGSGQLPLARLALGVGGRVEGQQHLRPGQTLTNRGGDPGEPGKLLLVQEHPQPLIAQRPGERADGWEEFPVGQVWLTNTS